MNICYFFFALIVFNLGVAYGADPLFSAIETSTSALSAHSQRIKTISENIANESSTGITPGAEPYKRKTTILTPVKTRNKAVQIKVRHSVDNKNFRKTYEPMHPAADKDGYVLYPNIDKVVEYVDAKEAQRSFEANLNVIDLSNSVMRQTLGILR